MRLARGIREKLAKLAWDAVREVLKSTWQDARQKERKLWLFWNRKGIFLMLELKIYDSKKMRVPGTLCLERNYSLIQK